MDFPGFRPESFEFFAKLRENNNREWFAEHEAEYVEHVLEPFRALARSLDPELRALSPKLAVDLEDVDQHFSLLDRGDLVPPGTPPYKTMFNAFFWDREFNRLSDGCFYIGLNAEGVTLGLSIYDFGNDPQAKMRRVFKPRLRQHLRHLDEYIKLNYLRRGFDFHRYARAAGRLGMKEVDAFPESAPKWENTLGWVVKRQIHTESSRLTPGSFLAEVKETFERLYPLYVFAADPREDWRRTVKVPHMKAEAKPMAQAAQAGGASTAVATSAAEAAPKPKKSAGTAAAPKKTAGKKKTTAKKSTAKKKTAAKKATTKKAAAKKSTAKKSATKKSATKKKATTKKKTAAKPKKRATTKKKAAAKKTATRKKATTKKKAAGKVRKKK